MKKHDCPQCLKLSRLMLAFVVIAVGVALKSVVWGFDRYSLAVVAATFTLLTITFWKSHRDLGKFDLPTLLLSPLLLTIMLLGFVIPPFGRLLNKWATPKPKPKKAVKRRSMKTKTGNFSIGETVSFPNPTNNSRLTGIVSKVNKNSVNVITGVDREFGVSPELLRREGQESPKPLKLVSAKPGLVTDIKSTKSAQKVDLH